MAVAPRWPRVFVAEQTGSLRVIKNDALFPTPLAALSVASSGKRGCWASHSARPLRPAKTVYIYYTSPTPSVHNWLSRFTSMGDVAVPGNEVVLLDLNNLSCATNHNDGASISGPDGQLYVAVGENATGAKAQTLTNLPARCCA